MNGRAPAWRDLRDPVMLVALGFGSGLVPRGPGTAGTLVGVGLYLVLEPWPEWAYAVALLVLLIGGIPICGAASRRLGQHDHPAIVLDEIASFLIVMAGLPAEPGWVVAGFAMFRLVDIHKPWPISIADRVLPGGLGVMADDVLAALLACGVLHLAHYALEGLAL